jgi:translation initiation factor IF-2
MVNKKSQGRAQDLTQIRAEEEMKLASVVVGRTVYTPAKRKKVYTGATKQTEITEVKESKRVVNLHDGATAEELAGKLSQKFEVFANNALKLNLLVKKDDYLGIGLATQLAAQYNYRVENVAFKEDTILKKEEKPVSDLPLRNPIITIMGHVDHGKTTLLDYIRKAKVAAGEAGGITQHIGAYSVDVKGTKLTFLDTPGHAAFGAMRQRGANVTDLVILVVAADDGVMPQTKESIRFCKNAGVNVIVAVNKMDKEGANPEKIKQELMEFELTPEEWGGDTQYVPISALQGDGIDDLLEAVQLQTEMMELRSDPKGRAAGVVIESKVEQGRGPLATILVQSGTLKKGDSVVVGETWGRARSLMDSTGKMLKEAGPSVPVQVLGLNEAPSPGDIMAVAKNDKEAKKVVANRVDERKALELASSKKVKSLEDFFADVSSGEKKILKLLVRSDVQGSFEAIKNSIESLGNDEVGVQVIGGGVGAITDNDVEMAASSEGYIIGFNMRPMTTARRLAEQKGIDIKTYSIIYELINDIKLALEGMLEPEFTEKFIGRAQVKDTFNIPKIGLIAGSSVIDGKIERGCNIRLLRDGKIVFDGKLSSLKRFKDDVKEVKNGLECGIALEGFNDVKVDDLFEAYILEKKERKLAEQTL